MQILDGKALAQQIETEIKSEVGVLSQKGITRFSCYFGGE